jgi:hypothetical protein
MEFSNHYERGCLKSLTRVAWIKTSLFFLGVRRLHSAICRGSPTKVLSSRCPIEKRMSEADQRLHLPQFQLRELMDAAYFVGRLRSDIHRSRAAAIA